MKDRERMALARAVGMVISEHMTAAERRLRALVPATQRLAALEATAARLEASAAHTRRELALLRSIAKDPIRFAAASKAREAVTAKSKGKAPLPVVSVGQTRRAEPVVSTKRRAA